MAGISGCGTYPTVGDSIGISPFEKWKTLETEHFRFTFPDDLSEIAMRAANYYEEAHAILAPRLYWQASYKVSVLLLDNSDLANGMTTPMARFGMVLFVTPPENWFSTNDYDDWLRLLIVHEYTHMLNMDPTLDFWSVLRVAFGDTLLPNALWPGWMLEGLAVYMETRFTGAGRGRGSYYEMILRTAVEAGVLDTPDFVTLDKIGGNNPYFPGGETSYFFGYQLMNRVAHENLSSGITADGWQNLKSGEDALGVMSLRSATRMPFLINSNLRNITGKDWYNFWDNWVSESRVRAQKQLDRIKNQPLTKTEILAEAFEIMGPAVSPDGNWLAYTSDSVDRNSGLYLKNLHTGETLRISNKITGATHSFTPDSQTLIYSKIDRNDHYSLWSDLWAYNLKTRSVDQLTQKLRAKDPDVSRDGSRVVFTVTRHGKTGIGIARLEKKNGSYTVFDSNSVFDVDLLDRASTPKFLTNGREIVFSFHKNGTLGESLMLLDLETHKAQTLVSNGKLNRFPAIRKDGEIFFVSDMTGVDNLFHYIRGKGPELVSNFSTGIFFPTFAPSGEVYCALFSYKGWNLSRFSVFDQPVSVQALSIDPPPAPEKDSLSVSQAKTENFPIQDYSVLPSIWPRQWFPDLLLQPTGIYVSGQVVGFDTLDRHRYSLFAGFDSQIPKLDWSLRYANRSLGPTLAVNALDETSRTYYFDNSVIAYERKRKYSAQLSYPFLWTYSKLNGALGVNVEQIKLYASATGAESIDETRKIPSVDGALQYINTESSHLAITAERGRVAQIGSRFYLQPDQGRNSWKGFISDIEHFSVGHSVFVPSFVASSVTHTVSDFVPANVVIKGRTAKFFRLLDEGTSAGLNELTIRGYPKRVIYARSAAIGALDFRFPIERIFRGWGTNPFFLNNVIAFTFGEASYFPLKEAGATVLPSAGFGLGTTAEVLNTVPISFSLQYHEGFRAQAGGQGEFFAEIGYSSFDF